MSFPNAEREWKRQPLFQFAAEQLADVFHGRIFEKIIPRPVIVMAKYFTDDLLEVGEIDDHAVLDLALDSDFDFIGVAVERPAFGMSWQKMGAINVFSHTKLHGVRIAQAWREGI
jgi:hypothetical protein